MFPCFYRCFSTLRITFAKQHSNTSTEVPEFYEQQLQENPYRVHQHATVGTGTRILVEHVPVATQANRDRYESEIVREASEDLVPESQSEVQERRSSHWTESEMLLPEDLREKEGRLRR